MNGLRIICAYLFLIAFRTVGAQEIRGELEFEKDLGKHFEVGGTLGLRKNLTYSDHLVSHGIIQADAAYAPFRFLKFKTGARYAVSIDEDHDIVGVMDVEDKLRFTTDVLFESHRWDNDLKLSNRVRCQYMVYNSNKSETLWRNKLELDYKLTKHVNPYIALEPFYSFGEQELESFRLYLGADFEIFKHSFDFFVINEFEAFAEGFSLGQIMGFAVKL